MASAAGSLAFGYPLRRTTRHPIFLPPLFWNSNHLDLLRVSLVHFVNSRHQSIEQQIQGLAVGPVSVHTKNLPTGCIDPECLRKYWFWTKHADEMGADWLPGMIAMLIDSVQKDLGSKPFIRHVKEYGRPPPVLKFKFANTSTELQPELLLRTSKTNVPFFIFSTAAHRVSLREDIADTLKETSLSWRILREVMSTDFEIDPFDVSCMIAMAQEQAIRFRASYLPKTPTHLMVYLMTPNPSTSGSIYLFAASIPQDYLDAIENLDLEVKENIIISREVVEIPSKDVPASKLGEGDLVERLGEILGNAYIYHEAMRVLQDEKDLHDRKFARVQSIRATREKQLLGFKNQSGPRWKIALPTGSQGPAQHKTGGI